MKKGMKVWSFIVILTVVGLLFSGLIDTTSATNEKTTVSVTESSPWFTKGTNSGSGPWYPQTYAGHNYISTYVGGMSGNPSQPDCWAEFKPYLSQSGKYEVYAHFYACKDTSTKVPFTVKYDGGSTTIKVNQYRSSPAWKEKYLGTWNFKAGADTYVKVTDATGEPFDGIKGLTIGTIKFVKVSQKPDPPTIISPGTSSAPGTMIDTLTPELKWNSVSGADYYALAIREDPPNGPIVYNPQQVYGTSHSVPSGKLKDGHEYRWNMQAHGSGGWSSVSNTRYFQTSESPPSAPTTTSPGTSSAPGPVIDSLTPTLQWNAVSGAGYYALAIREDPPNGPIVYNPQQVYGTSHSVPSGKLKHGHEYRWNMQAHGSGGWSSVSNTRYFQTSESPPSAPTTTSPGTSSAPGPVIDELTPTLQWNAVSEAGYYALAIREDPPNGPIVYNPQQVYGTSHSVPSGKLKHGHEYRWNMQAHGSGGWSSVSNTRYFQTSEAPPNYANPPTHVSPSNGKTEVSLTPTFKWNSVSGADYYGLYISEPPYGESNLVYNGIVYGTSFNLPADKKLQHGVKYHWNMASHNSAGWSYDRTDGGKKYSDSWQFTTEEAPPNYANTPTHVSPSNGKTEVSLTPTFKWNSVSGADYYGLYISEPPYGESNLVYNGIVYGTSFNLPADKKLQHGVKYYWNMASHNSAGWSYDRTDGGKKYSDSWYFTTKSAQPTGSIIVTTNLDQSAFTITGPKTYQGSGKSWSTSDSPDGTYTITFGDASGYITPSSETKILSAGGSITFGGTYIAVQPPTVETRDATDITETEATINGMITDDGGASIDERRFDWGTTSSCSDGYTNSITVSGNSFSYRLTGLQPGTKYYFRAGAKNSAGWGYGNVLSFTTSQSSATVSSPPRNLRVSEVGDGYVKITWDPPSSDGGSPVTNYKIYRGTSSGAETLYYTTSTAGTTFNNCANIVNGVTYYYKVKAVNAVGDSDFSNEVSAIPPTTPSPQTGSIRVTTNLDIAFFTITGPETYQAIGKSWSISNAPAGLHTITYTEIPGYIIPSSETKTLSVGGSITFSGSYTKIGLYQLPATRGKISWFSSEGSGNPGAWGEWLGENLGTDEATKYWYCAMRWPYYDPNTGFFDQAAKDWWHNKKILLTNPKNDKQVVLAAKDWGPTWWTGRVIDVSKTALDTLGVETDDIVNIEFADQNAELGPVERVKFNKGDWVEVILNLGLRVRDVPGIGSNDYWVAPKGSLGVIIDGPERKDGYTWWKIMYDHSPSVFEGRGDKKDTWPTIIGWSAEGGTDGDYFKKSSIPTSLPKFLTLPFKNADIKIPQGWVYTWTSDPNAHKGIDYIEGSIDSSSSWQSFDVVAAADGWAMWSEQQGSTGVYGKFVVIRHDKKDYVGNDFFTLYAHLESVASGIPYQDRNNIDYNYNDPTKWKSVKRGEVIGRAGNTGASNTGIHLHFEVQRKAYAHYKTDPYDLYKIQSFYPGGGSYSSSGPRYLWTTDPPSLPSLPPDIGYAVLVAGQGDLKFWKIPIPWEYGSQWITNRNVNRAYQVLRSLGFDDDRILYLNNDLLQDADGDGDADVDWTPSNNGFKLAMGWARLRVGKHSPFILYLAGHGEKAPEVFFLDKDKAEGITPSLLNQELSTFPEGTRMHIVIDACYSGCFITSPETISSPNRIIITSAHDDQKVPAFLNYLFWSPEFWLRLQQGKDVKQAFIEGTKAANDALTRAFWAGLIHPPEPADFCQPWLDDNGDSVGHPPESLGDDGNLAATMKIGVPGGPPSVGEDASNPQLFKDCYDKNGGASKLGYPVGKVHRWKKGYIQDFRGGDGYEGAIMQPDDVNCAYAVYGSIWSKYLILGGAEGVLGYPLTDELSGPVSSITGAKCRYNKFYGGAIVHHATRPKAGLTVFLGHGIFNKWEELNYGESALGLPTSDEREAPQSGADSFDTTGVVCDFEGGYLYWHRVGKYKDKAFETHGAIDSVYQQEGGPGNWLGFPISDEYIDSKTGYARSDFEGGYITTPNGIDYHAYPYTSTPSPSPTTSPTPTLTPPNAHDIAVKNSEIPVLTWPLKGEIEDRQILLGFGDIWTWTYCGGLPKKHTGVDLKASDGEAVFAAYDGVVKAVYALSSKQNWGKGVVIEHSGFTTTYMHVNPVVNEGAHVNKGQKIAIIGSIDGYEHLHFGVRNSAYSDVSKRGALPQKQGDSDYDKEGHFTGCENDPLFPEKFIDPMKLKYGLEKSETAPKVAKPVLTYPLKITPEKDKYYVGDTLTAQFTITNKGTKPITLDKLTVGGRLNGECPDNKCPDFTFRSTALQPNDPYQYTGTLTLTQPGEYRFFIAYYIENPTPEEKKLLDENNWNTSVDLGDGLTDEDRIEKIEVLSLPEGPYIDNIAPTSGAPGIVAIIRGKNFKKYITIYQPVVRFGAITEAKIVTLEDTEIVIEIPSSVFGAPFGSIGEVDVKVEIPPAYTSNTVAFTYSKPAIDTIYPPSAVPCAEVTIKGENFGFRTSSINPHFYVKFGNSQADIISWKDTEVVVKVPTDYGTGTNDVKFIIKVTSLATGGFWGEVIGILADLFVPGVALSPSEDGIIEDVIVSTTAGTSNKATFTYKVATIIESHLCSPGELRVYDSEENVTGLVNSEIKEEIPNSAYFDDTVIIFSPDDTYRYEVKGTDIGSYGLSVTSIEDGEATTFTATDIPTSTNAIHQYTIDWAALSQGEKGVTVKIDSDGNDVVERTIITNNSFYPLIAEFTVSPENPLIGEEVTLDASTSFDLGGGEIMKYRWEFYNAANQNPFYVIEGHDKKIISYSFTSEGIYRVRLTVTDDEDEYSYTESSITIKESIKEPAFYVPDDYSTIQAAVDAASAGDTIIVRDGTYTENVDIDKSITLKSSSGNPEYTIVKAVDPYDDVFSVTADNVKISGFTVTEAPAYGIYLYAYGIYLHNADYCDISDNICSHRAFGIYLEGSNSNSISDNTCINNEWVGISLNSSTKNSISNNTCSNNGCGGIGLACSTKNSISNNTCSNNGYGGICLECCNQNSISNNLCCNNELGIGIYPCWVSDNNCIYLNNFINNDCNAYSHSSTDTWYSPVKLSYTYNGESHTNYLGNYWSDYTGTDANNNGIGDSPYSIDTDQDDYPLMTVSGRYFNPSPTIPTPPTSTLTPTPRPTLTPPRPTLTPTPRPTLRPTATLFEKIEGLIAAIRVGVGI